MKATGVGGELRVGHQRAAALGTWSFEATPATLMVRFVVDAVVHSLDRYWITQAPMSLELRVGRDYWCWGCVRHEVGDGRASIYVSGKPRIVIDGKV